MIFYTSKKLKFVWEYLDSHGFEKLAVILAISTSIFAYNYREVNYSRKLLNYFRLIVLKSNLEEFKDKTDKADAGDVENEDDLLLRSWMGILNRDSFEGRKFNEKISKKECSLM